MEKKNYTDWQEAAAEWNIFRNLDRRDGQFNKRSAFRHKWKQGKKTPKTTR